jgi:hypothetical protein
MSLDLGFCYTNCIDCSQHLVVSMVAYETTSHTNASIVMHVTQVHNAHESWLITQVATNTLQKKYEHLEKGAKNKQVPREN